MLVEPLVESMPQDVMAQVPITKISGILPRVEILSSFLEWRSCDGGEKRIVDGTLPILQASIMLAQKNSIAIFLFSNHPYIKSLNKLDKGPSDMAPVSFTSWALPTVGTTTSICNNTNSNNDLFFIKCSVTLACLNKGQTACKSRHCRSCQCLLHYAEFELVEHIWPGFYKPLYPMNVFAMCLLQDLCGMLVISLLLHLYLLICLIWKGISLPLICYCVPSTLECCHWSWNRLRNKSYDLNGIDQKDRGGTISHFIVLLIPM